jgi:predicted nuclease of predicted toxin-antitoxin system
VRFLIDNALSPVVAAGLREAGREAVHVRDYGLREAEDVVSFARAAQEGRVIISADTDFGTLLAVRQEAAPSVILLRRGAPRVPRAQVELLVANLPSVSEVLAAGSVVVFDKARVRIRSLPIASQGRFS